MTARFYSVSNNSLPPHTTSNLGDMIVVFKAALITGYGTTPSAGWEILYESLSNNSDSSYRIAVRSQSPLSEQKIFEIIDFSATEGVINCWQSWSGDVGVDLIMSAKVNKNSFGTTVEVVANDVFVHFTPTVVYHGFGDAHPFDAIESQTILYNMTSSSASDTAHYIGSTVSTTGNKFIDANGHSYVCRSFCKEARAYGALVTTDLYVGGDTNSTTSGVETSLRKTELLRVVGGAYKEFGYLPMFYYTDNPRTMEGKEVTIDGVQKKIAILRSRNSYLLCFLVDV